MLITVRLFVAGAGAARTSPTVERPGFVIEAENMDAAERAIFSRLDTEHPGRVLAVSPASDRSFVATVRALDT